MVVCHCERVSHRKIAKAVRSGCSTLRTVCEETGAGQGCGGCVSSLRKLVEEHLAQTRTQEVSCEAT